jgi:hypothetical protein
MTLKASFCFVLLAALSAGAAERWVKVLWDPVVFSELGGYMVHVGASSNRAYRSVDVGLATEAVVPVWHSPSYVWITSNSLQGSSSEPSRTITWKGRNAKANNIRILEVRVK